MIEFPATYRAANLLQGRVAIQTLPFPVLQPKMLAVKVDSSYICRADVHEVEGQMKAGHGREIQKGGPLFGHEFVGEVVHSGSSAYKVGDRVTFNPNITGDRTTAFAEYFFVHGEDDILQAGVIPLPPGVITPEKTWVPEPFACIVHSLDTCQKITGWPDMKNKKVAVLGLGNAGTGFGLYARHIGAEVAFFNRNEPRRRFTVEQGIVPSDSVHPLDEAALEQFKDSFDVVMAVPSRIDDDILRKCQKLIRNRGGFIHLYGNTRSGQRFLNAEVDIHQIRVKGQWIAQMDFTQVGGKFFWITGAYGCTRADFEKGFDLVQKFPDEFPLHKMISKTISLDELPDILMGLASGSRDYPGKVMIRNEK